jgi:phosphoserine phosphatase
LSPIEEEQLKELIITTLPNKHSLNFSTWSRKAVAHLALVRFNKKVAVRTMGDYLKRWGNSYQKPVKQAKQLKEEDVKEWREKIYPDIEKLAKKQKAVILFGDEAGVHTESFNNVSFPQLVIPR